MPSDKGMSAEQRQEGICDNCGRGYLTWFAPNEVWNRVKADGFLCLDCFAFLAEERGIIPTAWMLTEENVELSSALETLRKVEQELDDSRLKKCQECTHYERFHSSLNGIHYCVRCELSEAAAERDRLKAALEGLLHNYAAILPFCEESNCCEWCGMGQDPEVEIMGHKPDCAWLFAEAALATPSPKDALKEK